MSKYFVHWYWGTDSSHFYNEDFATSQYWTLVGSHSTDNSDVLTQYLLIRNPSHSVFVTTNLCQQPTEKVQKYDTSCADWYKWWTADVLETCGTPELISFRVDLITSTLTHWRRFWKWEFSHVSENSLTTYSANFISERLWFIVLKAFSKPKLPK